MENPAAEVEEEPLWTSGDDTVSFVEQDRPGPFAWAGTALDWLLGRSLSCLVTWLVLALVLYLVMWLVNDVWYSVAGGTSVALSTLPLEVFYGGMGCGAAIVLAILLIVSRRVRRPHP